MSRGPVYRFQRGEPIVIARQVVSGDPAGITVSARLKKTNGQIVPAASVPATAQFEVQFEAAAGGASARWVLMIPATATAAMQPGQYAVDARFEADGEVIEVSDPAWITLVESVSG